MSFEGVAEAGILENIHQHAVAMDLSAFADVDYLLALHEVGE